MRPKPQANGDDAVVLVKGGTVVDALGHVGTRPEGDSSPRGRWSHSDTTLNIPLVILHAKYTGWRKNDVDVYA